MSRYDAWDESAAKVRPGRRGSRPRTKDRPKHEDAVPAVVTGVDRGRWTTLLLEGSEGSAPLASRARPHGTVVVAMRARELGRKGIVVGDVVGLVGDVSGAPDTLARIVRVHDRSTMLRRTADDTDPVERPIVANADQLVVVSALADPAPSPGLIDRCLVAAYDAGMDPLLVLTKADLTDPEPFLRDYAPLQVPHVVTSTGAKGDEPFVGLEDVRARLTGRISVLVGHSGVGKSTLVNALVPGTDRATGHVNAVTGRGRHTSTSAVALPLPDGGWVIDTPGVRSFGLAHVDPERLLSAFPDLVGGADACPRGCTHDEPECGLPAWVAAGRAGSSGPARLESFHRLLRSREAEQR
ncbi:ribosome small subunit-dependent GTPase A [Janibacter massiliensis]|uniref:ribosome small subunit-dependent GTPase A n=1 Tax=Janibacter massiliensis TaxID=2058291 RepID=UPI0018FEADD9|nr:ribosome small subunit-dependent GTPase A [Janibacter massiliensis]